MIPTVLISGAAGKTGRAVLKALAGQPVRRRGFVRRPGAFKDATIEEVVGDLTRPADWAAALAGVDRLYLICPNMHPAEADIGRIALSAARAAGLERVVYHSVLHPQTEKMPHHWQKLRVEEVLFESGLPFVILQPAPYMQNLRPRWPAILEKGELTLPYPVETRLSLVDLADVAAIARRALLEIKLLGGTFELAGTPPLSQVEVARELGAAAGRPVRAVAQAPDNWSAENPGLPTYARETLLRMFDYYARWGLVGNPAVLAALLERAPTMLAACAAGWS